MSHEVSVTSVGAAVQDVLLSGKVFKAHTEDDGELVEEFKLGGKYEVDNITFSTGGGATNGAVTFSRQGLRSIFMGKIGHDPAGEAVIRELKSEHVDISRVVYSKQHQTGFSTILISPRGERVVLVYRGASTDFTVNDFDTSKINTDWLFITSMAGKMDVIKKLVEHARATHMKVALIPGSAELAKPDELRQIIRGIDIVSANFEETQSLVGGTSVEELAINLAKHTGGIGVVTDGPNGVSTSDGVLVCRAGMYEDVPVVDRLGAGDAFASGFVASIAKGGSMQDGILLGSANSTSVVSFVGAKTGILSKDSAIHDMQIDCWQI